MALNSFKADSEKSLFYDRLSFLAFIFAIVGILLQSSLILVSWNKLPPLVPLFYSRPWGESILTKPAFIWILPGIAAMVCAINLLLASAFAKDNLFLTRIIFSFSFFISLALLWDVVKILSLLV